MMTASGNVRRAAAPSVNKTSRRRLRAAERVIRSGDAEADWAIPAARAARGDGPVLRRAAGVTVPARRSRTDSWRWNEEIESAGRLSLRFCKYGGNSTA